jgi:predicted ester cyclase
MLALHRETPINDPGAIMATSINKLGVRAKMHGVYTGEFLGIAPTGEETEVRAHDFHEIVDGRIVRTHHMEDWLSWFQQVGSWPSN